MPLWNKTDELSSAPKFLKDPADFPAESSARDYFGVNNSENVENAYFVDITEAAVEENRAKGIKTPGWILYNTYTDSNGNVRNKTEVLVPMKVSALNAGDSGVANNTVTEDATIADS